MNTALNAAPKGPKKTPSIPAPSSSKLEATANHIGMCLGVLGALMPYVVPPTPDSVVVGRPDMDGGAALATVTTVIRVCERLDSILADEERWEVAGYNEHLDRVRLLTETSLENARAHALVLASNAQPAAFLNPRVFCDPETGNWVTMLPGVDGMRPLLGVGRTPAESAAQFNERYTSVGVIPVAPESTDQPPAESPVAPSKKRKTK